MSYHLTRSPNYWNNKSLLRGGYDRARKRPLRAERLKPVQHEGVP